MAAHEIDVAVFRAMFPAYANPVQYPDAMLSGYWSLATCYIDPNDWCLLSGNCLQMALYLMLAHLAWLNAQLAAGTASASIQTSASVGSVSVSMTPPPSTNGWQAWLSHSPYGLQLWALLEAKSAGGMYIGGSHERAGIRKAGGIF